ncbi:MAG: MBL fold metallo-hydrolase [Lachnospiraceae bacterium]|nr:MBL fold metallo-hydrolase [Lachnospiraceae bacterium]
MIENITVNDQSSIRIGGEQVLYFDPFNIKTQPHDAGVVFFTHSHYDHFSPDDFKKVANENTIYVTPADMEKDLRKAGIDTQNMITMKPGEKGQALNIEVEAVPSYNLMKPFHLKKNGWLGYVVTVNDTRIYVCGDMDATSEGKAVNCDIALVPIGGKFTMNVKEAAAFVNEMKPKIAIPTHYGSIVGKKEDGQEFARLVDSNIQVVIKLS